LKVLIICIDPVILYAEANKGTLKQNGGGVSSALSPIDEQDHSFNFPYLDFIVHILRHAGTHHDNFGGRHCREKT
jgi:hypothetical protein